jgi:hypothetical protein
MSKYIYCRFSCGHFEVIEDENNLSDVTASRIKMSLHEEKCYLKNSEREQDDEPNEN